MFGFPWLGKFRGLWGLGLSRLRVLRAAGFFKALRVWGVRGWGFWTWRAWRLGFGLWSSRCFGFRRVGIFFTNLLATCILYVSPFVFSIGTNSVTEQDVSPK